MTFGVVECTRDIKQFCKLQGKSMEELQFDGWSLALRQGDVDITEARIIRVPQLQKLLPSRP